MRKRFIHKADYWRGMSPLPKRSVSLQGLMVPSIMKSGVRIVGWQEVNTIAVHAMERCPVIVGCCSLPCCCCCCCSRPLDKVAELLDRRVARIAVCRCGC